MSTTSSLPEQDITIVYLPSSEARLFNLFRKHQVIWERIFDETTKGNKVILHFDHDGALRKVEIPVDIYVS